MENFNYIPDDDNDNVSIHSIVTENANFESDNEAPEDQIGQIDKIIKNHVVKEIITPGSGLDKPSKNDFVVSKRSFIL
jgi:hypothetical protein